MRRWWVGGCLAALVVVLPTAQVHAGLIAAGPNALSVSETVADLGGGVWEYSFSFLNTDTSAIWHFLLYTEFDTVGATSTFPAVAPSSLAITAIAAPYDARNVVATLTDVTNTWYAPFATTGLAVGGGATFTFQASTLDLSPKLFAYETLASGYAVSNGTGAVAAYGYTSAVPEPGTLSLIGLGLAGLAARRRHQRP